MKKYVDIIAIVVIGLAAFSAHLRIPSGLSDHLTLLDDHAIVQGDSIQTLAVKQDSLAVVSAKADSALQAEVQYRTQVLADTTYALRVSVTKLQQSAVSASRVDKLEGEAKQSLDISKLNREELELLKRTFGDHVSLKAKDAHGNRKVASSNSSPKNKNNNDWWDFVSQGKGGGSK